MNLVSIRIITSDIKRLVDFYETVTALPAQWLTDDFAELKTASGAIGIATARTVAPLGDKAPQPATNRSIIIEFRVDDVDREHARIDRVIGKFVLPPTTMPWGNRSMLFHDPDGNLINIFAPVTAEAKKRFDG